MFRRIAFQLARRALYRKKVDKIVSSAKKQVRKLSKKVARPAKKIAAKKTVARKPATQSPKRVAKPKAPKAPKVEGEVADEAKAARRLSGFSVFCKENYAEVATSVAGSTHKEKFSLTQQRLSEKWKGLSDSDRNSWKEKAKAAAPVIKPAVKRGCSPYASFIKANFEATAKALPEGTSGRNKIKEVSVRLAEQWKKMTPEDKAKYGKAAAAPAATPAATTSAATPTPAPAAASTPITPTPTAAAQSTPQAATANATK